VAGSSPAKGTVNGFAVDPRNPMIMYVAMRDGLFKSMDTGASWKRIGTELNNLAAVTIDPKNPNNVYVATTDGAIYVSDDTGIKWKKQ